MATVDKTQNISKSGDLNGGYAYPVPAGQQTIKDIKLTATLHCWFSNNPVFAVGVYSSHTKKFGVLGRYWLNCGLPWDNKTRDIDISGASVWIGGLSWQTLVGFSKANGGITHIIIAPNIKANNDWLYFAQVPGLLTLLTNNQIGGGSLYNLRGYYTYQLQEQTATARTESGQGYLPTYRVVECNINAECPQARPQCVSGSCQPTIIREYWRLNRHYRVYSDGRVVDITPGPTMG